MVSPSYDPFPKYLQIREIISRWLSTLKVGDLLSTEVAMSERFGVSRLTIRQALKSFEQDGVIVRRAGSGSWLAKPVQAPSDQRLTGPIEEFSSLGLVTSARMVSKGAVDGPAEIVTALKLRPAARLFRVRRLRLLDAKPLLVLDAFFPLTLGREVMRRHGGDGLFVPTLREVCGDDIWEQYQKIEATGADATLAELLDVAAGTPVLTVNRVFVDALGVAVVYFRTLFRSDRYYYTVKLAQPKPGSAAPAGPRGRRRTT